MKKLTILLFIISMCFGTSVYADETLNLLLRPDAVGCVANVKGLYQFGEFMSSEEAEACRIALEDKEIVEYIRSSLLRREPEIYLDMEAGFEEPMYPEQLQTYYQAILNNCPEIYFVSMMYQYYVYDDGTLASLVPIYTMSEEEIAQTQAAIDAEVEKAIANVKEGMSDYDKALAVHDYFVDNYEYDYENLYDNEYMRKYNIASIFIDKKTVCQGYSLGYQYVLEKLGIECTTVQSGAMVHLWNLVQLENGNWYHVDVTWDDPGQNPYDGTPIIPDAEFETLVGTVREYFMVSDGEIQNKEEPHYEYSPNDMANCYMYDNASIAEVNTAAAWCGGDWYYVDRYSKFNSYNALENTSKNICEIDGGWPYVDITFSDVYEYNGKVYFNTAKKIMCYDPIDEFLYKALEIPEEELGDKEIYASEIKNGEFVYTLATDYTCADAQQGTVAMQTLENDGIIVPTALVKTRRENGNTIVSISGIDEGTVLAVEYLYERPWKIKTAAVDKEVVLTGIDAHKVFVWNSKTGIEPLYDAVKVD